MNPSRRKHVVIVGASQGLGEALAREMISSSSSRARSTASRNVYCVTLAGRNLARMRLLQDELNAVSVDMDDRDAILSNDAATGRAFAVEMDVSNEESVKKGMEAAHRRFGEISVLVFNAGVQHDDAIMEWGHAGGGELGGCETFRRCAEVNYLGAAHVVYHALPYLKTGVVTDRDDDDRANGVRHRVSFLAARFARLTRNGATRLRFALRDVTNSIHAVLNGNSETVHRGMIHDAYDDGRGALIVGISSLAGIFGCVPGGSAYASSKAGMDSFFESVGAELRSSKRIETLIFDPGSMDNPERQVLSSSANRYISNVKKRRGVKSPSHVAKVLRERIEKGTGGRSATSTWRIAVVAGLAFKFLFPLTFRDTAMRVRYGKNATNASSAGKIESHSSVKTKSDATAAAT